MTDPSTIFSDQLVISGTNITIKFIDTTDTPVSSTLHIQVIPPDNSYKFSLEFDQFTTNNQFPQSYDSTINHSCMFCDRETTLTPIGGYEFQQSELIERDAVDSRTLLLCSECKQELDTTVQQLIQDNEHQFLAQYI